MKAAWVVITVVCMIIVEGAAAAQNSRGDKCCNGDKILDTIQKVVGYGGHRRHYSYHKRHFTAFTAYLGSQFTSSQNYQKVIFDKVVTNYGNAYNHKDGVFTSPTDGVYTFENIGLSHNSKHTETRIVLNGKILPIASFGNVSGSHGTATVSAVLQLKKGDRVWIASKKGYTLYENYSSFSGWLLHEI